MIALRIMAQVLTRYLEEEKDLERHQKIMNKLSRFFIEDVLLNTKAEELLYRASGKQKIRHDPFL